MGWRADRVRRSAAALGVASIALLAACSDDPAPTGGDVSAADFQQEATRLCAQHGTALQEAGSRLGAGGSSDAERVSFLRSDFIPRTRAIIRGLNRFGYPADQRDATIAAFNDALDALQKLEDDPYNYLDHLRRGDLTDDTDYLQRVVDDFDAAGLGDC